MSRIETAMARLAHSFRKTLLIRYAIILLGLSPIAVIFQNCGKGFQAISSNALNSLTNNQCTPGANQVCSEGNGAGNQVCNSQGDGFSVCALSSCNSGYTLQSGM